MNKTKSSTEAGSEPEPSSGPNLVLIYSLLGAVLVIAMAIAVLIVLPFYHPH
ncbi:MAG TPA: hypothetical protein VHZ28_02010 [Terracidiphilus sp.]|jgi:hypothetical protein|nr:hypothetical protein [Terracidiphilus sp.]